MLRIAESGAALRTTPHWVVRHSVCDPVRPVACAGPLDSALTARVSWRMHVRRWRRSLRAAEEGIDALPSVWGRELGRQAFLWGLRRIVSSRVRRVRSATRVRQAILP